MNISGSGSLPGGVYNESISISGSGRIQGDITCQDFSVSGSGHICGSLTANGCFRTSGSSHIEGDVCAEEFHIAGSGHINGKVQVKGEATISGSTKCETLRADTIRITGGCNIEGDLTAEVARISGSIQSDGLLNAEDIEIRFHAKSRFGSIGGSKITILPYHRHKRRLSKLFSKPNSSERKHFTVLESIEGDELYLEYVNAKEVSGRIVTIGPGCNIEELTYSESLDLSPEAHVTHIGGPDIMEVEEKYFMPMH